MENVPKKRGRKKKIIENINNNGELNQNINNDLDKSSSNELNNDLDKNSNLSSNNNEKLQEQVVIKKRGRKKKWEVETKTKTLNNNPVIFGDSSIKQEDSTTQSITEDKPNYEQEQISFGNLNIKIQSNKENTNISDIKNLLKENSNSTNKNKSAILKSSKQKSIISNTYYNRQYKILKFFEDEYSRGTEIVKSDFRCYNCHHNFSNKPFYLPVDYCQELNRYKVMGNFCSPNCVKSYALSHKIYSNKAYLVGQMYRKLLGHQIIKKAPPIQCLKEYGGYMDINEYRNTFNKYDNTSYSINNLNSKVLFEEISIRNSIS